MGKHLERGKLCVCPLTGKVGFWLARAGDTNQIIGEQPWTKAHW